MRYYTVFTGGKLLVDWAFLQGTRILTEAGTASGLNSADIAIFVAFRLPDLNKQFQLVLGSFAAALSGMQSAGSLDSTANILTSLLGIDAATGSGFSVCL